jgi:signal transduction histidine kinase/ligand-binding sensor domain-containing protein/AraC-like DNA-binding protein
MLKKKLLLSGLIICFSVSLFSQPYSIQYLGIEQGLSNSYIMSITQDKQGFMWFATEYGLNRFDGKTVTTYKKRPANLGLTGNELNKVFADPVDSVIWIATQREGLNRFDCQAYNFTSFVHDSQDGKSLIENNITDIAADSKGNLWVSTYWGGIDYYDKSQKAFIHYNKNTLNGLASNRIWAIADDHKGKLYIAHVDSGLSILNLKDNTLKNYVHEENNPHSLPANEVLSILIDKFDNVWIGTVNGLALYNTETQIFNCFKNEPHDSRSAPAGRIFSICQMSDDHLWFGTENGGISILNIRKEMFFSPQNISFEPIYQADNASGLSNMTVKSIYEDSFHNIWIGTYGGGINFISHKKPFFHQWAYSPFLNETNTLTTKVAWGMCEDGNGNIWVGTDGGGIQLFKDKQRIQVYTKENSLLKDNAILSAFKDSQENLWFGTFKNGVNLWDFKEKRWSNRSYLDLSTNDVRCFFEDKNQQLYIGTNGNGMYSYHLHTKEFKHFTTGNSGIPNDELIRAISLDAKGRLWVGSFGQGVSLLDSTFQLVQYFNIEKGFYSNSVNCIFRDSNDQMWVGTGEGLVVFPDKEKLDFTIYTEKDGLSNSSIRAIAEDTQGDIWFSTNGGISRFSTKENKFYNYNQSDGVPYGNFMDGSVVAGKDGSIYFGSQNGVCYFNPSLLSLLENIPPVIITGFYRYNHDPHDVLGIGTKDESYRLSSSVIRLQYTQNSFTLSFNVMDYALENKLEYAYQLEGLSKEWYNIKQNKEITFHNLPYGHYTFFVKAKLNNQDWSTESTSISIIIAPPFWLTWWAKAFYVLVALALILSTIHFFKNRLQLENGLYLERQNNLQQQQSNEERLRFFTNITHELRTPLTLIVGPLEDISNDPDTPLKMQKKLSLIYQNALRLMNLITKILDLRKIETNNMQLRVGKADLSKLLKEIGLQYTELNQNKNLAFTVSIETQHTVLYFDPETIYTIVDNLTSNAFKYTKQGEIKLSLRTVEGENAISYTEIEVSDTGCGIPQEALPKIFDRYYQVKDEHQASGTGIGLALVKNLVQLHQADVFVESQPGKGASFKLRLITNNIYPNAIHEKEGVTEETVQAQETPAAKEPIHTTKKIILVVEDNMEIAHYIADSFSDEYFILTAENGKIGLESALANIPDIIISDIMMPELSGLELCSLLKKDVQTSHIPVILLTAKTSSQDKQEGYSVGADSYITKPFSSSLLKSRVENLMKTREDLARQVNADKINKQKALSDSISELDNDFLEKIIKIIKDNSYSETLDIEFIAQNVCMSHSTLYRKIKALTGLSINEFIRKIKMKYAEELLLTGRYTISEIAFHVGINSITYFRQCFKDEFGTSPSEYISKLKE